VNRLVGYLRFCGAVGRGHSLKRERLAKQMHISVRQVKKMSEESRLAGIPILYNTDSRRGGIFLAETDEEIQDGIDKMTRLALSLLRERSALKRALKKRRERVEQRELFG